MKKENLKIFAKTVEDKAMEQIQQLANSPQYCNEKIRIMPDCHAGAGCTIGTTMTITDKITPNLVGVDIGCGMLTIKLGVDVITDFDKLDRVIKDNIPHGFSVHEKSNKIFKELENLICRHYVDLDRAQKSIGTLGGGNHFIEVAEDKNRVQYLIIHSGSRGIGNQVAKYYQKLAESFDFNIEILNKKTADIIAKNKALGTQNLIQSQINAVKKEYSKGDNSFPFLTGLFMDDYMKDLAMMQIYATYNRDMIAFNILELMNITYSYEDGFHTIHNYIDIPRMILRKGAVSANKNEILLIPMNMRDGSLLCIGKGNKEWNYSAPHGAGRLMSRTKAKSTLTMDAFEIQMKGVHTSSVCKDTLDEAPDAYKPMKEIIDAIKDTVEIIDIIKPVYNFKSH